MKKNNIDKKDTIANKYIFQIKKNNRRITIPENSDYRSFEISDIPSFTFRVKL